VKFVSHFSQSSENSVGHVFHLFKLNFSMVTSLVLLSKRKISKSFKKYCRISDRVVRKPDRFVSRLHQIESFQNLSEDRATLCRRKLVGSLPCDIPTVVVYRQIGVQATNLMVTQDTDKDFYPGSAAVWA